MTENPDYGVKTVLSPLVHQRAWSDGRRSWFFWCPASSCQRCHVVDTPRWKFSGDAERPSFTPSLKITAPPSDYCCHVVVTDGALCYCDDCNHELRGQRVSMVPIPEDLDS